MKMKMVNSGFKGLKHYTIQFKFSPIYSTVILNRACSLGHFSSAYFFLIRFDFIWYNVYAASLFVVSHDPKPNIWVVEQYYLSPTSTHILGSFSNVKWKSRYVKLYNRKTYSLEHNTSRLTVVYSYQLIGPSIWADWPTHCTLMNWPLFLYHMMELQAQV